MLVTKSSPLSMSWVTMLGRLVKPERPVMKSLVLSTKMHCDGISDFVLGYLAWIYVMLIGWY